MGQLPLLVTFRGIMSTLNPWWCCRAQFKINTHRCWNWHHVHSRQVVSCPVQPRARHWSCVFWRDFSGVKRTCWTTGSWRSCLSLEVVSSIPVWSTIIYRFLCGFICVSLCQSIKIKPTNMYIASARAQFKINTHRCWNWHHVHSRQVVSCPVQPRARHWSCVFWRDFSGVKRTCWTTGSWRSCLSLEVVSSIPVWSTIIYRFLCGFICVSLCQSIKIKPTNIYICGEIITILCAKFQNDYTTEVDYMDERDSTRFVFKCVSERALVLQQPLSVHMHWCTMTDIGNDLSTYMKIGYTQL